MNDYSEVFELVQDALANALSAFEECQDYPLTCALVSDALDRVNNVIERDSKVWNISIPSAKEIVESVNRG